MGLILPSSPGWADCTTNITATSATTMTGTSFTAGTANVDGTAVSMIAAITHDVSYIVISPSAFFAANNYTGTLADILIDPAGGTTWASTPLISDLMVGSTWSTTATTAPARTFHFPVRLKAGTSIGGRVRSARASQTGQIAIHAFGPSSRPDQWWAGDTVHEIGLTPASSGGTNHTAGSTGAYSSWTNFGSTTPAPARAIQFAVQGGIGGSSIAGAPYLFEFGVAGTRIGPTFMVLANSSEVVAQYPAGPIFCDIPSGTQLQVRGACSGTANALDVGAYIVI